MPIKGLDHVNIIAADLEETAAFYQAVLGLRRGARPDEMGFAGSWLLDEAGRPIIHLMTHDPARHGDGERHAMPTGSIDHVAFACQDFAATVRRCEELGISYRSNVRKYGDFSQIFVTDPNNVMLELNFPGE